MSDSSTLHIYAQEFFHTPAVIAGNREALEMLKRAVDKALAQGVAEFETFQNDGEGYDCTVVCGTEDEMNNLYSAYTGIGDISDLGKCPEDLADSKWPKGVSPCEA
ncbi:hypothetical protein [Marinobacter salarius]|uniref:Uncharacterized protein n=1 Tax=Marinobacter salarius TaxID=1420917 RepID=A0A1W6K979_9GAMM|nr:hypothetical protein [Marinobacter salarius]ARM83957.1 hypothetical protein MARSALSMR5_01879 [Marinobacter salarius]